jgi:hypothetical protein
MSRPSHDPITKRSTKRMPLSVRTSETTLSQRVYVVTGARSGIGAASANKLASKTATAVVADFDEVAGQPGRGRNRCVRWTPALPRTTRCLFAH